MLHVEVEAVSSCLFVSIEIWGASSTNKIEELIIEIKNKKSFLLLYHYFYLGFTINSLTWDSSL